MLIEKSQQLIQLSEHQIKLKNDADKLEGFETRQQQISQAVAAIEQLIGTLRTFRQKGIADFDLSQKAKALLDNVVAVEANFQENSDWILDSRNFKGNILKSNVEELTNLLKQQLIQAWKNYLFRRMPSANQEILNLLGRVEEFKTTVQRVRNINALIPREEFPKNNEEFENIERLIGQLQESWDSLSSEKVPDSVLQFLRAATNQGASLHLLTPEVKEWVHKHGIADSLRIRLM